MKNFGDLLADFNKLARSKAAHRLVLLAADPLKTELVSDNCTAVPDQVGPATEEDIGPMQATPTVLFEVVWQHIVEYAGQDVETIRGIPFTYEVHGNTVKPLHVNYKINKSQFAKAYARCPLSGPGQIHDLIGPSYIYAILSDQRIVSAG